jgi:hypothetical protein
MKYYTHYQPKEKGKSDFYSWNLFRWLRKQDKESIPALKKTKIYKTEDGALYIGSRYDQKEKNVSGFSLRELCSAKSNNKFPAVFWHPQSDRWEDVTDWFWPEYERVGVCAIWGDMSHDWIYLSDRTVRVCQHCEAMEKKKIKMVKMVAWESAQ